MLELRARERVEATILDQIIGTYLADFVKDVAQETLKAGLRAKRRAEDEVTLEFSTVRTISEHPGLCQGCRVHFLRCLLWWGPRTPAEGAAVS